MQAVPIWMPMMMLPREASPSLHWHRLFPPGNKHNTNVEHATDGKELNCSSDILAHTEGARSLRPLSGQGFKKRYLGKPVLSKLYVFPNMQVSDKTRWSRSWIRKCGFTNSNMTILWCCRCSQSTCWKLFLDTVILLTSVLVAGSFLSQWYQSLGTITLPISIVGHQFDFIHCTGFWNNIKYMK